MKVLSFHSDETSNNPPSGTIITHELTAYVVPAGNIEPLPPTDQVFFKVEGASENPGEQVTKLDAPLAHVAHQLRGGIGGRALPKTNHRTGQNSKVVPDRVQRISVTGESDHPVKTDRSPVDIESQPVLGDGTIVTVFGRSPCTERFNRDIAGSSDEDALGAFKNTFVRREIVASQCIRDSSGKVIGRSEVRADRIISSSAPEFFGDVEVALTVRDSDGRLEGAGQHGKPNHDKLSKHIIPLPFDYALHTGEEFAQRQASDQTGDFPALPSRYPAYQWHLDDMLALPSEKESLAYLKEADEAREILKERTRQITLGTAETFQKIAALYALAVIMGVVLAVTSIGAWHKIAEIDREIALAARR